MLIHAYGLFWRADEINWAPGSGRKGEFCLLGRKGANRPNLRVADFRKQRGVYILYGNYGPYYVGLTRKKGLGNRLKDHLSDDHRKKWDRFSWFGFCNVQKTKNDKGFQNLADIPSGKRVSPDKVIKDLEALLIKAMALENIADMNFSNADEWFQIKHDEVESYCDKVSR